MSEYQCYEFVAVDRPLTRDEMDELRAISTRAQISATRFWNEYEWGDLKGDPAKMMARYFDAHRYVANWGTHRLMLKLPTAQVDVAALEPYFGSHVASLQRGKGHVIVDLSTDEDESPDDDLDDVPDLATLSPIRAALLQGDMGPAYVAWLLSVQTGEVDEDETEPPVPASLAAPDAALTALVEFLRVDPDLVEAAAEGAEALTIERANVERWVKTLPARDKDAWLVTAVLEPERPLHDVVAAYRRSRTSTGERPRRTDAQLLARREEVCGERMARESVAREKKRAADQTARAQHLAKVQARGDKAWRELDELVDKKHYATAVQLTVDLRDIAIASGTLEAFEARAEALRKKHARRAGYRDAVKIALRA
jgi:hypothetical protein